MLHLGQYSVVICFPLKTLLRATGRGGGVEMGAIACLMATHRYVKRNKHTWWYVGWYFGLFNNNSESVYHCVIAYAYDCSGAGQSPNKIIIIIILITLFSLWIPSPRHQYGRAYQLYIWELKPLFITQLDTTLRRQLNSLCGYTTKYSFHVILPWQVYTIFICLLLTHGGNLYHIHMYFTSHGFLWGSGGHLYL